VLSCGRAGADFERAVAGLSGPLKPKRLVAVADWPRNAQEKSTAPRCGSWSRRSDQWKSCEAWAGRSAVRSGSIL